MVHTDEIADHAGKRTRKYDKPDVCPNSETTELGEDDLQTGACQAVQDAITNYVILRTVLKNLSTVDLVRGGIRRVSKHWNTVATEILKTRSESRIVVDEKTNFKALRALIAGSADFPFREIVLVCRNKDFRRSPEKWLRKVGLLGEYLSLFTRLGLILVFAPDTVTAGLLSGPFNHIEHLGLHLVLREENKKNIGESKKDTFPDDGNGLKPLVKLKSIALGQLSGCDHVDLTFLSGLLQYCPNLERVQNFTSAYLQAFSTAGKLELVKSLRVCENCIDKDYPRPSSVEALVITADTHEDEDDGDLTDFCIDFDCFKPLLESNRDTLRRFEVKAQVMGGGKINDWPTLSNLTVLKLWDDISFPYSVENVFPVLTTIELADDKEFFDCHFHIRSSTWKEPLNSVTKLKVSPCLLLEDWKCLSKSVPNVRQIFLNPAKCCLVPYNDPLFSSAMDFWGGVSYFQHLETLYISPIELDITDLDQFFTGIFKYNMERLRANPQLPLPAPEFINVGLRERPSVASLSGLKELVIRFTMADEVTREKLVKKQPISHVSLQYGLNMVPADVKIYFLYDHWSENAELIQEALAPVAERVIFGHWNANLEN